METQCCLSRNFDYLISTLSYFFYIYSLFLGGLHLTKGDATKLMALYFGLYALARLLAAFLTIKLTPNHIMAGNGVLLITGTSILLAYCETSRFWLHVGYAITGMRKILQRVFLYD